MFFKIGLQVHAKYTCNQERTRSWHGLKREIVLITSHFQIFQERVWLSQGNEITSSIRMFILLFMAFEMSEILTRYRNSFKNSRNDIYTWYYHLYFIVITPMSARLTSWRMQECIYAFKWKINGFFSNPSDIQISNIPIPMEPPLKTSEGILLYWNLMNSLN